MDLEKNRGSTWCSDSTRNEMGQIDEYDIFKDLGKDSPSPVGYNKI